MVDFYTMQYFLISRELIWQLIPILIILSVFISHQSFRKPIAHVIAAFLLGVSVMYPLELLVSLASALKFQLFSDPRLLFYYDAFFQAAFIEECLKFSVIYFFCLKLHEYSRPTETYIYAIAVGLGYAAIENLMYFKMFGIGIEVRYLPMFAHLSYALLMATFLNQSMFHILDRSVSFAVRHPLISRLFGGGRVIEVHNQEFEVREISKRLAIFLALAIPILFHGIWNILLQLQMTSAHQVLVYVNYGFVFFMHLFVRHVARQSVKTVRRSEIPARHLVLNYFYVFLLTALSILIYPAL